MALTLVILAAGMGTRFGGPKQLVSVGPNGESILDVNISDAAGAGFERVVIVTRSELVPGVGPAVERASALGIDCQIAVQLVPAGRAKPLGTAAAVASARHHTDGPFGVANADDVYGPESFAVLARHLVGSPVTGAVVGFRLADTVPASGGVSRAVLDVDRDDRVRDIVEVHDIERTRDGWRPTSVAPLGTIADDTLISLNLWGFPAWVMAALDESVRDFGQPETDEIYLPKEVAKLVTAGRLVLEVLRSSERWVGITNPSDVETVRAFVARRPLGPPSASGS